ncbi:Vegetative catalase [compost metagenome]
MDEGQRSRLAANLARSLVNVEDDAIVQAQLRHFEQADPEYAKRVSMALAALQR